MDTTPRYAIETRLAVSMRFPDGQPAEGWGRILRLRHDGLELETHFNLKENRRLFLAFEIEGFYRFEEVPARVSTLQENSTLPQAFCAFEPGPALERLREALVFLVDRS